jgi:hypothetical protein
MMRRALFSSHQRIRTLQQGAYGASLPRSATLTGDYGQWVDLPEGHHSDAVLRHAAPLGTQVSPTYRRPRGFLGRCCQRAPRSDAHRAPPWRGGAWWSRLPFAPRGLGFGRSLSGLGMVSCARALRGEFRDFPDGVDTSVSSDLHGTTSSTSDLGAIRAVLQPYHMHMMADACQDGVAGGP